MTRLPGALFTVFPPGGAPARQCARPTGPGDQGAALSQLCACSFGDPLTLTRLPPAPRPQRGLEACRPVAGTEACGARGSLRPLSPRLGSREKQDGANPSAGDISAGRGPSEPPAAGSRVGDLQRPCWSAGRGTHGLSVPGALALPDAPELRRSSVTVPVRPFRKHLLEPGRGCLVRTAGLPRGVLASRPSHVRRVPGNGTLPPTHIPRSRFNRLLMLIIFSTVRVPSGLREST